MLEEKETTEVDSHLEGWDGGGVPQTHRPPYMGGRRVGGRPRPCIVERGDGVRREVGPRDGTRETTGPGNGVRGDGMGGGTMRWEAIDKTDGRTEGRKKNFVERGKTPSSEGGLVCTPSHLDGQTLRRIHGTVPQPHTVRIVKGVGVT